MKIAFSKYSLFASNGIQRKPREGALLKVFFAAGSIGYADCHPWEELGDVSLDGQLKLLAQGKETSLTTQSLVFAKIDAKAREEKCYLFQDVELPKNHYHIADSSVIHDDLLHKLSSDGIKLLKVKMGPNLQKECKFLKEFSEKVRLHHLKLRLDFNCKLEKREFLDLLNRCPECLDVVDFFEDPFAYDPLPWQEIRESKQVKLACDKDSLKALAHPHSCDYLVVKPAIQEIAPFLINDHRPLVLTSYLDHPIGQLSALYTALILSKNKHAILSKCGFLSHHAYAATPFSERFKERGSRLIPASDSFGWGYEDLLNALIWNSLS